VVVDAATGRGIGGSAWAASNAGAASALTAASRFPECGCRVGGLRMGSEPKGRYSLIEVDIYENKCLFYN